MDDCAEYYDDNDNNDNDNEDKNNDDNGNDDNHENNDLFDGNDFS